MHVRLLTAQDGTEFQALKLEALKLNPQAFLATLEQELLRHEHSFSEELDYAYAPPHFGYFGAFDDQDKLIGYCQISPSYLPKQIHIAFMYSLYLTPAARGHHQATQLLQHIFDILTKSQIERVFLSCLASNKPAQALYRSLGFKRVGVKVASAKWQDQYDDEVEMVLVLKKNHLTKVGQVVK